jgi:hypothetical protein
MSTTCEPVIEEVAVVEKMPEAATVATSWGEQAPKSSGRLAAYLARRAHRRKARRERTEVIAREQRSAGYLDHPPRADWQRAMRFSIQR